MRIKGVRSVRLPLAHPRARHPRTVDLKGLQNKTKELIKQLF